jgi:hypothetical protein
MNHRTTLGTGFAIFVQEFHRLYDVGVTLVSISALLVTLFTVIDITETTKPMLIQEPLTLFTWTLTHKFHLVTVHHPTTISNMFKFPVDPLHVSVQVPNIWMNLKNTVKLIFECLVLVVKFYQTLFLRSKCATKFSHIEYSLNFGLCFGHECLFSLEEDILSVPPECRVPKIFGTEGVNKFPIPEGLTSHAVRVFE